MRALLAVLIPVMIVIVSSIGGCSLGVGVGYLVLGEEWDNVHGGLAGTTLFAVVLATAGFIVGSLLASRYVGRTSK